MFISSIFVLSNQGNGSRLKQNKMESLIKNLKDQTHELRDLFIKERKKFAEKEFHYAVKMTKWDDVEWCKYLRLTPEMSSFGRDKAVLTFPKGFYNSEHSKEKRNKLNKARIIVQLGLLVHLERQEKLAKDHYEDSIIKLAFRIIKKGLNKDNATLKSSYVGVNFETIVTDGVKTIRCFTVLAWGEIQRPHYRYLIK